MQTLDPKNPSILPLNGHRRAHPLRSRLNAGSVVALLGCPLIALAVASPAQASPWHEDVTDAAIDQDVVGDFDGDGELDRVVALPNYGWERGLVAILWGTGDAQDYTYYPTGPADPNIARKYWMDANLGGIPNIHGGLANSTRIDLEGATAAAAGVPSAPWTNLGSSVAVGRLDGDTLDDLVIGVPGAEVDDPQNPGQFIFSAGQVWVLYGADMAVDDFTPQVWHQNSASVLGVAENGDFFGEVVTTGDVNCDGFDDLIVGVPREDYGNVVDAGAVHVLYGSNSGVHADGDQVFYQHSSGLGETPEANDHFGAALATGTFNGANFAGNRECASLAIGAPGEDIVRNGVQVNDAGIAHVLYATNYPSGQVWNGLYASLGSAGAELLHQDRGSLDSIPEAGDQFGASLGRRGTVTRLGSNPVDDLWIGVPGEGWSCPSHDEYGTTQVLKGSSSGVRDFGDSMLCQSVRPDLAQAEAGIVTEKSDAYGKWLQYVPANVDPKTAELMIVAHGTSNDDWAFDAQEGETFTTSRGNANFYLNYDGWIAAADELNMIVIVPQFEEWNFGNTSTYTAGTAGGYRGLFGDQLGAGEWIELIADRYSEVGLGDGRFYLLGHSAGGQFTNRYVMHNDDRLLGAAIMSPQGVALPDDTIAWPSGLAPYAGNSAWPLANPIVPDPLSAQQTLQSVPVYYVVGEKEDPAIDPKSPDRVGTAMNWVIEVSAEYGVNVPLCILEDGSHSSKNNHRPALLGLFPSLAGNPVFQGLPSCLPL